MFAKRYSFATLLRQRLSLLNEYSNQSVILVSNPLHMSFKTSYHGHPSSINCLFEEYNSIFIAEAITKS